MRIPVLDLRAAMVRTILLTVLSFILISPLHAQTNAIIEGRITGDGGRPLAGAVVEVQGRSVSTMTSTEGYFRIAGLSGGEVTLRVALIGFQEQIVRANLQSGQTTRLDLGLVVNPLALDGILVEGQVGQAEALNRQRTAPSIRSVVSSEQIERFPDATVPDALRRIPGVSARPDRGETGFIFIRGLNPDLTTVTVDGTRLPSTAQEGRGVELSSIPSEMLASVEVIKAITPDMHADAVAGTINLQPRRPTYSQMDGRLEGGSHSLAGGSTYRGALNYSAVAGRFSYGIGGDFASQVRSTENLQYTWGTWQGETVLNRLLLQQYPIERSRYSVNGTLNYDLADRSSLFLRGFYSRYDTEEERHRLRYRLDAGTRTSATSANNFRTEREARQYKWEREIWSFSAGGNHLVWNGATLDYAGSASFARRTEPYRNYFYFRQTGVNGTLDPSGDPLLPIYSVTNGKDVDNLDDFRMTAREWRLDGNKDRDFSFGSNLSIPFDLGGTVPSAFKFGIHLGQRSKERDTSEAEQGIVSGNVFTMGSLGTSAAGRNITPASYRMGPLLDWTKGAAFYEANRAAFTQDADELAIAEHTEDYEALERVGALYGMATIEFGDLQILGGARYEHTSMDYDGKRLLFDASGSFQSVTPVSASSSYGAFFPAAHLRYRINPETNVRLAATRTIARPDFLDIAPNEYVRPDEEEVSRGNPDLKPAHSTNLDLLFERYLSSVGMVQGGVFYKKITDFAYTSRTTITSGPQAGYELFTPMNGAEATVKGAEIAWQQRLTFLPGALSGLGAYANFTYTRSETDFGAEGGRKTRLPEQFDRIWNLALMYDYAGFSGLISANYQSDFIDSLGSSDETDRWGVNRTQLDMNLSQQITPNIRAFLQLNNLTNEPYVKYTGTMATPHENEFEGFWGSVGLRFNLR